MSEKLERKNVTFEDVAKINVNQFTEKKDGLTYLSWAYAWREFKKLYPDATYRVLPYQCDDFGIMCHTEVTAGDMTYAMWLPVMNGANKAIKKTPYQYKTRYGVKDVAGATMFDINKTIMRCFVKNLAMFGLGIYIYAGEDLPEVDEVDHQQDEKERIDDVRFESALKAIMTGDYTEAKLLEKFQLTSDQLTKLNDKMIEIEEKIENHAKEETEQK